MISVGENKDINLLKELALVSHAFLQICNKHLFATVKLHDAVPEHHVASSKKEFVKLLLSRPYVVKYIRNLTYKVSINHGIRGFYPCSDHDDRLLSPILPNLLRTISRLNCLKISASVLNWNKLDFSLTSAFLHLMHLPTINHIDLSSIINFPLSSLTPSVNLLRLGMSCVDPLLEGGSDKFVVQSEMMPKIREFHTSESVQMTMKLLRAERQDGRPAFNFIDLRRLSISSCYPKWSVLYLLQKAKLLEHLSIALPSSVRLHELLSPCARTLKVLDLAVLVLCESFPRMLSGLCQELEAMAGHNMLEALSFEVNILDQVDEMENWIRSITKEVEKVLVKPGWSALRQVSFEFSFGYSS